MTTLSLSRNDGKEEDEEAAVEIVNDEKSTNHTTDGLAVRPQQHQQSPSSLMALQSWLRQPLSISKIIQPDYWPPRNTNIIPYYDWTLPTHVIYQCHIHVVDSQQQQQLTSSGTIRNVENNHNDTDVALRLQNQSRGGEEEEEKVTSAIIKRICIQNYSRDSNGKLGDEEGGGNDGKEGNGESKSSPTLQYGNVVGESVLFTPTFCEARSKLDYTYHTHVVKHRQYLQDAIIRRIVFHTTTTTRRTATTTNALASTSSRLHHHNNADVSGLQQQQSLQKQQRPWIVFTAGPMGVGKGYVITQLQQQQLFNVRDHFITIDPDLIKYELPEMVGYIQMDRTTAATKVHRESTQISDIIFEYAIQHSLSILVDGSLRDVDYYESLFGRIRKDYSQYRIAIIHITARRDVIYERATTRAIRTGRVIPTEVLDASIEQVPKSVEHLSPLADAVHVIANHPHQPIQLLSSTFRKFNGDCSDGTSDVMTTCSWKEFAASWDLQCVNTSNNNIATDVPEIVPANGSSIGGNDQQKLENDDSNINVKVSSSSLPTTIDHSPEQIVNTDTTAISDTVSSPSTILAQQDPKPASTTTAEMLFHHSVSMSQIYDDHPSHVVANAIWQTSYPNFCARCALVTDEQCGICIHNVHICACPICCGTSHPPCSSA